MTKRRFFFVGLGMMAITTPAMAADSQMVWYQCTDSSQCVAIPGSCSGSWSAVNAHFKDEATSWAKGLETKTDCTASKTDASPPPTECFANKCLIKKGE